LHFNALGPAPLRPGVRRMCMQKFRKTVLGILVGSFLACLAATMFIHLYYYETLPSAPDERAGRTFKMEVNHGFVRYGAGGELRTFHLIKDVVFPLGCFPFLAAAALGLKWGILKVGGAREA
jgi:hypothetical protein